MRLSFPLITLALAACSDAGSLQARALPASPCFAPESLRARPLFFGVIEHDTTESGDWGGVEVRFMLDSTGRLRAAVRDARGGLPSALPVDSISYDAAKDSLFIAYRSHSKTGYQYTFRPACDQLVGMARLFITATEPSGQVFLKTFPRVLTPPSDDPDRRMP